MAKIKPDINQEVENSSNDERAGKLEVSFNTQISSQNEEKLKNLEKYIPAKHSPGFNYIDLFIYVGTVQIGFVQNRLGQI